MTRAPTPARPRRGPRSRTRQTLVAHARSEAAEARAEAAQARTEIAVARQAGADARAEAAAAQAEAAEVSAAVAKATAERDAAMERAKQLAADRDALVNQFKVLSNETIERQGKTADAQAEARLKATEQLMVPVRQSLDAFNARLTEVEKERVQMSTDLRGHVQAVQQTGETLRRETGRSDDSPAKAADPRLLGGDPAPPGGRDGRHGIPVRLRPPAHHPGRAARAPAGHASQSGRGPAHLRRLQGAAQRLSGGHGDRGRAAPWRTSREVREERPHPRGAALRQAVLEGARHARVRRVVPAQRGLLRRGVGARAGPVRLRGGAAMSCWPPRAP